MLRRFSISSASPTSVNGEYFVAVAVAVAVASLTEMVSAMCRASARRGHLMQIMLIDKAR